MARTEPYWHYRVAVADLGGSHDEAFDKLIEAIGDDDPVHYGKGFAGRDDPRVEYLIQRANRAKARRLAARLAAAPGVHSDLVEFR